MGGIVGRDGDEWDWLARKLTSPDPSRGYEIAVRLHPFAGDSVIELAVWLRHAYEKGRREAAAGEGQR